MGTGFHTTYAGSYVLVARAVSFPGGIQTRPGTAGWR